MSSPCTTLASESQYTDVVVIGNGPTAICLSFFLSGFRPYYNDNPHSNNYLLSKLQEIGLDKSIINEDLEYLSEGLEGRSSNPVALLFDALMRPDADYGAENPPLVDWRWEKEHATRHMILGKGKPGGAWQKMDGSMQTLSLGNWMELPHISLKGWQDKKSRDSELYTNRATMADVKNYYSDYVEDLDLQSNFYDYHTVTSVQKVFQLRSGADSESGEVEPCCKHATQNHPYLWEVRGYKVIIPNGMDWEEEEGCHRVEFCIRSPHVVIATGTFDIPNRLKIPGETFSGVLHSLQDLEKALDHRVSNSPRQEDPVLIVGAGLSAADAILMTLAANIPVIHVFRRGANDQNIIFKKLPSSIYPEYHRVHSLMKGKTSDPLYRPYEKHRLEEIKEDMNVLIENTSGNEIMSVDVSLVVILIGSRPDLSFLPNEGRNLGVVPRLPIDSKHNPIDIDLYSYQSTQTPGLFSMGPLVGENFVRFGIGGALGITNYLVRRKEKDSL